MTHTDDITLVEIVAEEISTPEVHGSRRSGLYRVPIRLSREPDPEWADLLIRNWDHPVRFTSAHRPGIARVEGDSIVLDGTNLEEIERNHRDTLKLAVAETNRQWREMRERRQTEEEARRERDEKHRVEMLQKAKTIKFD